MGKKYWIHIGIHKTGTTFLQRFFDFHREWLLSQGFIFPKTGLRIPDQPTNPDAMSGHAKLFGIFKNPEGENARNLLRELHDEVESSGVDNVLISSETFSALDRREICSRNASAVFKDAEEIRLVCYLRRQDRWLESFYLEVLGWRGRRETRTIGQFFDEEGQKWLDYGRLLNNWKKSLGEQALVVRSYDDAVSNKRLLPDFLECLNIDTPPPSSSLDVRPINPSLPASLSEFVRAINAFPHISNRGKSDILLSLMTTTAKKKKKNCSLIENELWKEISGKYKEENNILASDFVSGSTDHFQFAESRSSAEFVEQWISNESAKRLISGISGKDPAANQKYQSALRSPSSFGVIATIKQSPKQTREFINYHLNLGADHLVIFFDDPNDLTIAEYDQNSKITCVRCTESHWKELIGRQPQKMAEKLRSNPVMGIDILRKKSIKWGITIDGDELIFTKGKIKNILSNIDDSIDVLKLKSLEAVQSSDMNREREFNSIFFKKIPVGRVNRLKRVAINLIKRKNRKMTRHGFFGHTEGKSFYRTSSPIDVFRSHVPKSSLKKLELEVSKKIFLLHYDAMSYENWKHKWWRRIYGDTHAVNIGAKRKCQTELIRKVMDTGDEKKIRKLFNQMNRWSRTQLYLGKRLGIIIPQGIEDKKFDLPKSGSKKRENETEQLQKTIGYPKIEEASPAFEKNTPGSYGIVTTIKQNLKQTCEYINYHLNLGVGHMVIFFDDSQDLAIEKYQNDPRLTLIPCTEAYWMNMLGRQPKDMPEKQRINMKHGSELLRKHHVQWCVSIDGDELIYSDKNINKLLESVDSNIPLLKIKPREAIQYHGMKSTREFSSEYFKVFFSQKELERNEKLKKQIDAMRPQFNHLTKHGFFGHTEGKCFYRADAEFDKYHQHAPKNTQFEMPRHVSKDIFVLHYDCMSFENWKQKWWRRLFGETRAVGISTRRKEQEDIIRNAFEAHDEEALFELYRQMFWYSKNDLNKWKKLGLISNHIIPQYLFQ